jgi:RND superfamily putative drug exporter
VITAAVMVVVFASFMLDGMRVIELFGLGLAIAVLLDAIVVRCIPLPAVLELAGPRAWACPGWIDRRLPRLAIGHEGAVPHAQPTRTALRDASA